MTITVEELPNEEASDTSNEKVIINDSTTGTIISFTRVSVLYPRQFSINGKSVDREIGKDVPETIFITREGNNRYTEDTLLEHFMRQYEKDNMTLEHDNDPQVIRDVIEQIKLLRQQFSELGVER